MHPVSGAFSWNAKNSLRETRKEEWRPNQEYKRKRDTQHTCTSTRAYKPSDRTKPRTSKRSFQGTPTTTHQNPRTTSAGDDAAANNDITNPLTGWDDGGAILQQNWIAITLPVKFSPQSKLSKLPLPCRISVLRSTVRSSFSWFKDSFGPNNGTSTTDQLKSTS